jgi:hypothetical protein
MATTDLAIQIATTLDATGINKANKSVQSLDKRIKSLGRTLGLTLGATAMIAYGKAAVKAFAADEAAAKRLATAVDNLGLSFFKADVETFIGNLEKSASIADDVLRPAFQSLLTTTGSLTKSQELLNNAIQISRASGVALGTVVEDLNKGYVGVTRGLIKYNTGLTRAELQTKSFNEILGIVLAKSAGSAQAYLETTSFKLDALTLAGENAKETIGAGLVDAFARLGGGSSTADAVQAIDSIAKGINGITKAAGTAVGLVTKLYKGLDFLTTFGGLTGANGSIGEAYARLEARNDARGKSARSASPAGVFARTKQQRDAEAAAAKRAKELSALTKKQVTSQKALTAEQKKQNALKKAGTVFDLDQIQLVAALKGKLSEEDKIRLQAQLALLNGNSDLATRLTNQILAAQDSTGNLAKFLSALPNAKNPFEYLDAYLSYLAGKAAAVLTGTTAPNVPSTTASAAAMPTPSEMAASGSFSQLVSQGAGASGGFSPVVAAAMTPQVIELKITGDGDLTNTIAKNLMQQSLSTGNQTYVNRRTGGFE